MKQKIELHEVIEAGAKRLHEERAQAVAAVKSIDDQIAGLRKLVLNCLKGNGKVRRAMSAQGKANITAAIRRRWAAKKRAVKR